MLNKTKLFLRLYLGKITLVTILLLAFILRTTNINWDQGHHLHPDERFLTMVTNAMKLPTDLSQYLDPKSSLMNPANIGFPFFVYGLFPLLLVKGSAILIGFDNYSLNLLGRLVSAVFDCFSVIIVYLLVLEMERNKMVESKVKYFSAFFYATFALPIQLSHYYANDIILSTFILLSIYMSTLFWSKGRIYYSLFSGIALGLAFASKISALYGLPIIVGILVLGTLKHMVVIKSFSKKILFAFTSLLLFLVTTYLATRLGSPYSFETGNMFDLTINELFKKNLHELRSINGFHVWFPPAIHWMSKGFELVIQKPSIFCKEVTNQLCVWKIYPSWFALKMFAVFGVGIPAFVFGIFGILKLIINNFKLIRSKHLDINVIIFFGVIVFFVYQATQFVKSYRYFIWIYPIFAIYSGIGIVSILDQIKKRSKSYVVSSILTLVLVLTTLIWPTMFMQIYISPHTRLQASKWIYENIQNNASLLIEHWDDGLPLNLPPSETKNKHFRSEYVEVFAQDNDTKFSKINSQLEKADYYIISSGRSYATTSLVPWKYPLMGKFYQQLMGGELGYQKVAEFNSYPRLEFFGTKILEVNDEFEDDALIVYDHPRVIIFKNTKK